MLGRVTSFILFIKEVKGVSSKLKMITALLCGSLLRPVFTRVPLIFVVGFPKFFLKFRVAKGEITPYFEIKNDYFKIFPTIPSQNPSSRLIKDWVIIDGGANIGMF